MLVELRGDGLNRFDDTEDEGLPLPAGRRPRLLARAGLCGGAQLDLLVLRDQTTQPAPGPPTPVDQLLRPRA